MYRKTAIDRSAKVETSCISIRYTGYYVSTTSPVGSMILLPVDRSRKREHVLRARNGFAKQDVRYDTDTGVKFPGISRQQASSWQRDMLWKQGIHA